jgi:hypothetical protein
VRHMKPPSSSDLGLRLVNEIYDSMRIDAEWSVWEPRGFTWWGAGTRPSGFGRTKLSMTPSGMVAAPDQPGRIELAASVHVHEGSLNWTQNLFAIAVAMQAAEAVFVVMRQLQGKLACGLRPVTSANPQSGPRAEPDEMLNIFENFVNPQGQDASRYAGEEMEQLVGMHRKPPCVLASGSNEGIAAEFPYPGPMGLLLGAENKCVAVHV